VAAEAVRRTEFPEREDLAGSIVRPPTAEEAITALRPAAGFCRLSPGDDQNRRLVRVVGQLGQAVSPYTLRKYGARRTYLTPCTEAGLECEFRIR
jgi:hypothetical protein